MYLYTKEPNRLLQFHINQLPATSNNPNKTYSNNDINDFLLNNANHSL